MKRNLPVKLLCVFAVVVTLTVTVSATGFLKTRTYSEGTFKDVKSTSWYAKEVASAYELGFMNGKAEGQFAPDGNVTVAEAITMASRVHSIYNGKEIVKTEGKWYDMYVQYALANGIISEGQYTNFDRNIMRYEMAVMFADSMPKSYFAAKNNVKAIPDVNENEEYYEKLLILYNAGVVMGSTEYGDFLATNSIKRSETAAIINRVALPENRLTKTLEEYGDRDGAIYLIDDYDMEREVRGQRMLTSGWDYENTGNEARDASGSTTNALGDNSKNSFVAIHRPIIPQTKGVIKLDTVFTVNSESGARLYFTDQIGNTLFELMTKSGKLYAVGNKEIDTGAPAFNGKVALYLELNLDTKRASVVINSKKIGVFDMSSNAGGISKMTFSTTKEDELLIAVQEVHMYKNFVVMDTFRLDEKQSVPYGWTVNNAAVEEIGSCSTDTNSIRIAGIGSAEKTFDAVSGKFVFEAFVLVPETQIAAIVLKNGDTFAAKVEAVKNKFVVDWRNVRKFSSNVWQLVRIEGDTDKNTAVVKINGKKVATTILSEDAITSIQFFSDGTGDFLFDDVKLYNTYDYADYCPKPVPVNDDGYYVGMSSCSLWREGTHYGWDMISPYDSHTPVLGYYDEGIPEVADWEIKFQVEHGYDFQQYCWFVANQKVAMKETGASDALHDGYFNAKYSDMQKFAIMWENAGSKLVTYDYFVNYIWPYWVDWYLTDSRYMTIDNKPYINLYLYNNFVEQVGEGDREKAKKAIEFMDAECKKLGYDGVIVMFCNNLANEQIAKDIKAVGADGVISYTLGEMSYDAQYQKDGMNKYFNLGSNGGVTFLLSVGIGFNDIGWSGGRTPLATPEAHKDVFLWAKNEYLPKVAKRENGDSLWMSKFVIATTWNEFGEGHFIFPTNVNGFGYLDAARSVYSTASGMADKTHFDVEPTINQKKRLGTLYPAVNAPMKRLYLLDDSETNGEDYSKNIPVLTWDFEADPELCNNWQVWNAKDVSKMVYSDEEKAFNITTSGNDPSIRWNPAGKLKLDADEAKILHVRLKASAGATTAFELFWMNTSDSTYSGAKGINFKVLGNGEYNDYYFDLSSKANWSGLISSLRIDPIGEPSDVFIKQIDFISDKIEGAITLEVDGASFDYSETFAKKVGDEIYIAGNPDNGFYSLLNLYYEWNRWDGVLTVKANNGTEMLFTVGSNKVLVDGKEEKIDAVIDVVDGLVRVPYKFICEKAGYEVNQDGDKYSVVVREGRKEKLESESNKANWFEFNTTGDPQGWTVNNGQGTVLNGIFAFTASPVAGSSTGYDPSIANGALNIPTAFYKTVEVRMKVTLDEGLEPDMSKIYFTTTTQSSLSESKTLRFSLSDHKPDAQGYYTIAIDASKNEYWKESVNRIRFDPTNLGGYYEVDYIRFIADAAYEEQLALVDKSEKEAIDKLYAVDDGAPFYIQNADAELTTSNANLRSNTSIVEDDLIEGNHAYKIVPENNDRKSWVYFIAPTRFLPGAAYKVSFDARVICDHNGTPAENVLLSWNMRYAEMVDCKLQQTVNHYSSFKDKRLSTSDGWVHFEFVHTVSENIPDFRQYDYFTLFVDPNDGGQDGFFNYSYMVDNIKVEAVG